MGEIQFDHTNKKGIEKRFNHAEGRDIQGFEVVLTQVHKVLVMLKGGSRGGGQISTL